MYPRFILYSVRTFPFLNSNQLIQSVSSPKQFLLTEY